MNYVYIYLQMYVFAYLIIYKAVFCGWCLPCWWCWCLPGWCCLPCWCWCLPGWCLLCWWCWCLPGWCWCLPGWWMSSLFLIVSSGLVVSVRIYAADLPGGHTQRLLRAAAGLASKTKLQGKFARCDCSNYQLFMYSSRECFTELYVG